MCVAALQNLRRHDLASRGKKVPAIYKYISIRAEMGYSDW
jgi:hypothetical protein